MTLGKGGLCRVPKIRRSAKWIFEFFLEISSLLSAFTGALGKGISKKIYPDGRIGALGKVASFAECLPDPTLSKGAGGGT